MTPDKCPKCGAVRTLHESTEPHFLCGAHISSFNGEAVQTVMCVMRQRDQLASENAALKGRVKQLEEAGDALYENSYPSKWDLRESAMRKRQEQANWQAVKEAKP